jgi:cytochrome c553
VCRLSWGNGRGRSDYTAAQLTAFAQGTRNNSEPMHTIALRLNEAEVKAVADYIAGLH